MTGPNGMNAFCRSSGGNDCFTMASPCGIITAPKRPCRTRKAISQPAVGARPHSSDASVKPAMPTMNILRRPTMSPARAEVTSPTAKARVYAASTHCRVVAPPPSSSRIEGPARLAMVASRRSITSATITTTITIHR